MELRAFIQLFIRQRNLIGGIVLAALAIGFCAYRLQTQWYEGTVLLSVTQQGTETTTEYQYDHYYRLQADERMANTVARYLETPIGRRDIARRALLSNARETEFIEREVTALVLASNLIEVTYHAKSPTESERIAVAMSEASEHYIASLNEQTANRNWFTLVATDSFTHDGRFTWPVALGIAAAAGLFIAFWIVLGLWYWKGNGGRTE